VAGYSGDAGDAMRVAQQPNFIANGMMFSTPDSDNDLSALQNCAKFMGWWFNRCSTSKLNKDNNGIWVEGAVVHDIQASHMLVKLN